MTITVTDTATGQQLTVREVSAALAVPEQHVSAPYSRAVGHLDRWVRDSRRAVDEFAAWIEGQTAQAKAEMRQLCDELELPQVWAELPAIEPTAILPPDPLPALTPYRLAALAADPVTAYMRADDPDERPGRTAWVNVDGEPGVMPAQLVPVALPPRNDMFAGRFVPDPADYGPHPIEQAEPWWRRALDFIGQWVRL